MANNVSITAANGVTQSSANTTLVPNVDRKVAVIFANASGGTFALGGSDNITLAANETFTIYHYTGVIGVGTNVKCLELE
jgi:hypothetical protein|tara:strand:+ start:370 stop:609 length:240 start_codon:yes stop_codon:yes gene_type:complete